jgi:DNA polymerase-1
MAVLPSYKAQRPSMPDGLRQQLGSIEEYLNGAGIPWVRKEGVEADDLLGVAARRAEDAGAEVLILTSDKDFYQLVGEHIRILSAADVGTTLGPAEVFAKTGVKPEQIVEWLSLVGDSSDNIDGVPGVGAKTAAKLLGTHGSLEKLWNGLDTVKPDRIRNALALSKDIVNRNVNLIRLKLDMPLPELDWSAMAVAAEDRGRLMPFFEQLELRSLAETVAAGT